MTHIIRRAILAFALIAGIAPAFAQAPAPVPALPDTERRTTYSITSSTCACATGFALYGDGTDYQNWVEVWLNGVNVTYNDATFGWTVTSPSGPLANLARPISNAIVTFNKPQTGTVQIVGARRPRRTSQFSENRGVAARDLNQALTDIIAQNRETWDRTNDIAGRAPLVPPGETMGTLPPVASRANMGVCFDSGGKFVPCVGSSAGSFAAGSGITFTGTNPTTISANAVTPPQAVVPFIDAQAAGLVADGNSSSDGAMASGSTTLTSATANFTSGDVGKIILVQGAAASGNDLVTTIAGFSSSTIVTLGAANASGGAISGKQIFYGTDNAATLASVIASAGCKGTLWLHKGWYMLSSGVIDLTSCIGFRIKGAGPGATAGAAPSTSMSYLGASGPVIKMNSSSNCWFENVFYYAVNHQFTGYVAQVQNTVGNSSYNGFRGNTFYHNSANGRSISLDTAIEVTIEGNNFVNGLTHISGAGTGSFSNVVTIYGNEFRGSAQAPISGGGESWSLIGNTFEPLSNGTNGAFATSTSQPHKGMVWSGNWFGDSTVNGGTWIEVAGQGFTFTGNRIAGSSSTSNVAIGLDNVKGFSISGNDFQKFSVAIGYNTATPDGGIICGNSYTGVTAFISAGGGANILSSSCNASY